VSVVVLVDQIVGLDVKLEVGNVTQAVEVSGSQELLQTENAATGTNITAEMTASLPLANRQFTDLAVLTPGASFAAQCAQAGSFAVAGTRSQSTNWQIDGVNAIDPNVNGPTNSYRIADAIQELSVGTTAYSAAFGRASGGEVSVVTKSGTNLFHGGVFEVFPAREWWIMLRRENIGRKTFVLVRPRLTLWPSQPPLIQPPVCPPVRACTVPLHAETISTKTRSGRDQAVHARPQSGLLAQDIRRDAAIAARRGSLSCLELHRSP
jgi:hypothetical protein